MKAIRHIATLAVACGIVVCMPFAWAAGGNSSLIESAHNDLENTNSLQRGARNFMNYCVGCHSLQYVRYSRLAEDLELSEDQLKDNLIFGVDKINSNVEVAMSKDQSRAWFNALPPDLSLSGRSRGVDWLYSYLKSFYIDESRTFGVNNMVLEGSSMPHVLWELQGSQAAIYRSENVVDDNGVENVIEVFDHFEQITPGSLSPEEYDHFVRDTVNFLDYVGEPMKIKRQRLGMIVLGYLAVLGFLTYALKKEYWKDVD